MTGHSWNSVKIPRCIRRFYSISTVMATALETYTFAILFTSGLSKS